MSVGLVSVGAMQGPFLKDEVTDIVIPTEIALHILKQVDLTGANFSNLCRVSRTWYRLSNQPAILNNLIIAKFGNQKKRKNLRKLLQDNIQKIPQIKIIEENLINRRFSKAIFFHTDPLRLAKFKVLETGIKATGTDGTVYQWNWSESGGNSCTVKKEETPKQLALAGNCEEGWKTKHNNTTIKVDFDSIKTIGTIIEKIHCSILITIEANGKNKFISDPASATLVGTPIFSDGKLVFMRRTNIYGDQLCVFDFNKTPKDLGKDSKCSVQ